MKPKVNRREGQKIKIKAEKEIEVENNRENWLTQKLVLWMDSKIKFKKS